MVRGEAPNKIWFDKTEDKEGILRERANTRDWTFLKDYGKTDNCTVHLKNGKVWSGKLVQTTLEATKENQFTGVLVLENARQDLNTDAHFKPVCTKNFVLADIDYVAITKQKLTTSEEREKKPAGYRRQKLPERQDERLRKRKEGRKVTRKSMFDRT